MRATGEHELKLDAPAGFRLPPLGGRPLAPRVFTSVYFDVPGESLAAVGAAAVAGYAYFDTTQVAKTAIKLLGTPALVAPA
jgi:hypothetical protein